MAKGEKRSFEPRNTFLPLLVWLQGTSAMVECGMRMPGQCRCSAALSYGATYVSAKIHSSRRPVSPPTPCST